MNEGRSAQTAAMTLSALELELLTARCRGVPMKGSGYLDDDVVLAIVTTVLDYQQRSATVERALAHFRRRRWAEASTLPDLRTTLDRFADDRPGNERLAVHLWGYRLWTRASQLRGLVGYFMGRGVTSFDELRAWARSARFEDFRGRVPGLGFGVYQGLRLRLGANTVKPDVRLRGFVAEVVGRRVSDADVVEGLEEVARRLGIGANVLDWSLWDHLEPRAAPPGAPTT